MPREVGLVWFVDRDAQQFADWGIDYVKYDWLEWDLLTETEKQAGTKPVRFTNHKIRNTALRSASITISARWIGILSSVSRRSIRRPRMRFVREHCNLWRLTEDIHADWKRLIAPFEDELVQRLAQTRPGSYGDLDMLQIGPMGVPNRAEKVFRSSRLKPAEQYLAAHPVEPAHATAAVVLQRADNGCF